MGLESVPYSAKALALTLTLTEPECARFAGAALFLVEHSARLCKASAPSRQTRPAHWRTGRMLAALLTRKLTMTLCPIAIVAGCAKCPAVSVCPLKTVIGDAPKAPAAKPTPSTKE